MRCIKVWILIAVLLTSCTSNTSQWEDPILLFEEWKGVPVVKDVIVNGDDVLIAAERWVPSRSFSFIQPEDIVVNHFDGNRSLNLATISNEHSLSTGVILGVAPSDGSVYAVWGELPYDSAARPHEVNDAVTLVYSVWKRSEWSNPEIIYETGRNMLLRNTSTLKSHIGLPAGMVIDETNTLHLVFTQNNMRGLVYVQGTRGSWAEQRIIDDGRNPNLSQGSDGELFLVYTSAKRSGNVNSVFFMKSLDRGRTWSDEIRINASGKKPAGQVLAVSTFTDRIHVLWTKYSSVNFMDGAQSIRHAVSDNGGKTWSGFTSIEPPDGFHIFGFDAVGDSCGDIYIIFYGRRKAPLNRLLFETKWIGTHWFEPRKVARSDDVYGTPAIDFANNGILHLAWYERAEEVDGQARFSAYYSSKVTSGGQCIGSGYAQ